MSISFSRRDALKAATVVGAAAFIPFERLGRGAVLANRMPVSAMPTPFTLPFRRPAEVAAATASGGIVAPDGIQRFYPRYDLSQQFSVAEIMPGYKTPVFGYNGQVPGPTIRTWKGQPVIVRQSNALQTPPDGYPNAKPPAEYTTDPSQRSTSTHLHGSASLPQFDGYASDLTYPGQHKDYFYPNSQRARMLWYHDHGVHHTFDNVFSGLAGLYIMHDAEELATGLPTMADPQTLRYDVPLVIRDAMFDVNGGLIWDTLEESGAFGDVPLVNGVPWPKLRVQPRLYRFRILNASVSRSYEWELHDGKSAIPFTVVATDAGLMPSPQKVTRLKHGMAERYEIVVDFSKLKGATLTLRNWLPKNNIDYSTIRQVMQFKVSRKAPTNTLRNTIPANWSELVSVDECMTWNESDLIAQSVPQREFRLDRAHGQWTINDFTWQDVVDSGYTFSLAEVEQNAVEIWQFANLHGGWFHPMHIHLIDFKVLSRNGSAANVRAYEKGPKDVVYVGENETVRVAMRFDAPSAGPGWPAPRGRYMMHCHNLVHEDHDMMMQFNVGDPNFDPQWDPIGGAPAVG
jgi:spore coat protein A, manganese oxidase